LLPAALMIGPESLGLADSVDCSCLSLGLHLSGVSVGDASGLPVDETNDDSTCHLRQKFPPVYRNRRFSSGLKMRKRLLPFWRRRLKNSKSVVLLKTKEDFS
jgi:hypothetical protein